MYSWLRSYKSGGGQSFNISSEKKELIELRKEMKKLKKKYDSNLEDNEGHVASCSEDEDEDDDKVDELIEQRRSLINKKGPRNSVSAESYGTFNKKKEFTAKVIPKSDEQIERIQNKVLKSFIFNNLDEKELKTVVDAMEEVNCNVDEEIIKQGDNGAVLYIIEKGEYDCFKQFVSIFKIILIIF